MNKKTLAEIIIFISICLAAIIFVAWSYPVNIWQKGETLQICYVFGNKTEIPLDKVNIEPASSKIVSSLVRVNGLSTGDKRSGIFESSLTGDQYYYYTIGEGELVMFVSEGKNYVVDSYFSNGFRKTKHPSGNPKK